ncbi:MAG: hypothetical protein KJ072_26945 [Verrucomicrobia bacterium]|nr:hypothetical protein [Verrucomicrobiota bacterium]
MSPENFVYVENFIPLPALFYSFETGEPFSHCVDCGKALLQDGTVYLIQKAFNRTEVILEFAYCQACYQGLEAAYSRETMTNLWDFVLDSVNLDERTRRLLSDSPTSIEPWIESCLTCGSKKSDLKSYVLVALCDGRDLLFHHLPYMFCEACEMKMCALMSRRSRDTWERWIEDNLDVPPTVMEDIREGRIVLI